tara:strand:- start:7632 stop:8939 length:1308 start_codon:yes stop_codon:yes gene_type:complete
MAETIVAKRNLGNGKWDKVLKRRMVELSVADNYEEAKEEWIATGEVWWGQNDEIPEWVRNSQMGRGKCLCGHIVVYHFEIINTENGIRECVGSDHINTYLIMRAISEEMGLPIDAITDEQIQEWINVRVKSMKQEAWWKESGASFEMMFNAVKEMDLHYNTRTTDWVWDNELNRTEPVKKLVKKGKGNFGTTNYQMASIVWRWNHPDNAKAQINTRGYPNEKLMQDLALFYVTSLQKTTDFHKYKFEREQRKVEVAEEKAELAAKREARRLERQLAEEERERVYNLPENVEARRLAKEEHDKMIAEERLLQEQRRKKREIQRQKDLEAQKIKANLVLSEQSQEFDFACANYGIEPFDASLASNNWETTFLVDIKEKMINKRSLSVNQLTKLRDILLRNKPTQKQLEYLKDLGYEGKVTTKKQASEKIKELKGEDI